MTFKKTMATLFSTAEGTYYKWKKENRPIIKLLDKYFSKEELEEFLETGKLSKLEIVKTFSTLDLEEFKNFKKQFLLNELEKKRKEVDDLINQINEQNIATDNNKAKLEDIKNQVI